MQRNIFRSPVFWIVLFLLSAVVYAVYINRDRLENVIIPFIIGALVAYLLNPLVGILQRRGIPRWLAIVIIYLMFILLTAVCLTFFIPVVYSNISELISNIPQYSQQYEAMFNSFQNSISYSTLPVQVKEIVISQIQGSLASIQQLFLSFLRTSLGAINSVFSLLLNIILGMIIGFYILKDLDYFKTKAEILVPRRWRGTAVSTAGEINVLVSSFIQGQLTIAAVIGILEVIGLSIVGVKYAFILGLIGGIANIIPYFGPFIGAVPAVAIAFLDSPLKALLAVIVFVVVQQIDNAVITPRIMSEKVGMHPLLIIFVVLLGGSLFGILGLVLAVPVTAVVKVIGTKVIEKIV